MKFKSSYSKRGQNTAEYLIMLTLVAVASIGLFSVFGKSLRDKVAMVTAAIAGQETKFDDAQKATATDAEKGVERAAVAVEMKGQAKDELKFDGNK